MGQGPPGAGGVVWIDSPDGNASLPVVNHAVPGVANENLAAALDGDALLLDLARPWLVAFTISFTGPPPSSGGSNCQIQIGDTGGIRYLLNIIVNHLTGGADHVQVSLSDFLHPAYHATVPFVFGGGHVVAFTFDGTIHRVLIDGVEVVAGLLRPSSTLTSKCVTASITGSATAAQWTMYNFQFTAKVMLSP